ncbi:hypothetical protein DRQ07_03115 [candidate division KSB1 bacterium]|nr:MAG: hypothetical protein DRQ07_03115 [candidate division KSB1 bacterium]
MENNESKLIPSLAGGAVIAILSTFPVISAGNCLCCMWVIAGGIVAVYLYNKNLPENKELTQSDALIIGVLSGIFGALFATLINYFFIVIGYRPGMAFLESFIESKRDIAPEVKDMIESFKGNEGLFGPFIVFVQLGVKLIIYTVFSMLGGVIAGAFLNKKQEKNKNE